MAVGSPGAGKLVFLVAFGILFFSCCLNPPAGYALPTGLLADSKKGRIDQESILAYPVIQFSEQFLTLRVSRWQAGLSQIQSIAGSIPYKVS